ncbi:GSCOCG00013274001-RA-CDS [Cotesia congregata]|nr:GSCOCG00013274001-RA-CDS [Cotesia congregata]
MLAQDNTFRQTSEILVPNVKADIFEKLLEFIYTDQVRELDEFAENLLEVAQKFQVKELKHICEVSLSQFLSAENALRTLTLAKRRNSQKLADYVINFITVNATEVFNSNEYKQWEKEKLNPGLFIFQNSISKDKQSSKAEAKEKTSRLE